MPPHALVAGARIVFGVVAYLILTQVLRLGVWWLLTLLSVVAAWFAYKATFTAGRVSATAMAGVSIADQVSGLSVGVGPVFGQSARPSAPESAAALARHGHRSDGSRVRWSERPGRFAVRGRPGTVYSVSGEVGSDDCQLPRFRLTGPITDSGKLGLVPRSGVQDLQYGAAFEAHPKTPYGLYECDITTIISYN